MDSKKVNVKDILINNGIIILILLDRKSVV